MDTEFLNNRFVSFIPAIHQSNLLFSVLKTEKNCKQAHNYLSLLEEHLCSGQLFQLFSFSMVYSSESALCSGTLIPPLFMPQRCPIEFLAVVLPQRHETIHVGNETLVVMTLKQMNHFMDNDVL